MISNIKIIKPNGSVNLGLLNAGANNIADLLSSLFIFPSMVNVRIQSTANPVSQNTFNVILSVLYVTNDGSNYFINAIPQEKMINENGTYSQNFLIPRPLDFKQSGGIFPPVLSVTNTSAVAYTCTAFITDLSNI